MSFSFLSFYLFDTILVSLFCLFVSRHPHILALSLSRAQTALFALFPPFATIRPTLALSPSFIIPLCVTRAQMHVLLLYLPISLCLSHPFRLCLSPSFSHCSLSLRRRMSPTFESIARFRAHCLPSSPFCRPRARSSSFSTISSFTSSVTSFLKLPSPPPSLHFAQISSTIFAISITRAHLFLL